MGTNFQNEYNGIYTKIETSDQFINLSGSVSLLTYEGGQGHFSHRLEFFMQPEDSYC